MSEPEDPPDGENGGGDSGGPPELPAAPEPAEPAALALPEKPSTPNDHAAPPTGSAGQRSSTDGADGRRSDESARRVDGWNKRRQGERRAMGGTDGVRDVVETVTVSGGRAGQVGGIINNDSHDTHNHYVPRDADRARGFTFTDRFVRSRLDTYVPVREFREIVETIRAQGIVYLMGPDGSGRTATAITALRELCGVGRVRSVTLASDSRLEGIRETTDVLEAGHGHVVELPAGENVRSTTLASVAGGLPPDTYLVVIGPPARSVDDRLRPYAVGHTPPPPAEVLRRHLCRLLCPPPWPHDRCALGTVDRCLDDPAIVEHLQTPRLPGELAELAGRIHRAVVEGRPLNSALSLLYPRLRDIAVEMVSETTDKGFLRAHLRRMSLRVAYAVYFDQPLTVVFDAAATLFRCLTAMTNSESAEVEWEEATLFDGGVQGLLVESMGRLPEPEEETGHERRARVVDPKLSRAVLDVLWNEYDQVRTPLLIWLRELGADGRAPVRLRAASAAGVLASFNFSAVYREIFRPWATSNIYACRDAAAWSLEFVADDRAMTPRVRRQVQDWCLSPNPALNDTAARCYGTELGRLFVDEALVNLHYLARSPEQTRYTSIPLAVTEICWPHNGAVVLRALGGWLQGVERSTNAQAARSLLFLAHQEEPPAHRIADDEVWPALLVVAEADVEVADALRRLWQRALSEPITAYRAWEVLADWLVRANTRGRLEDIVGGFAIDLLSQDALRRRSRFYLGEWRKEHGFLKIFNLLEDGLKRRTATR